MKGFRQFLEAEDDGPVRIKLRRTTHSTNVTKYINELINQSVVDRMGNSVFKTSKGLAKFEAQPDFKSIESTYATARVRLSTSTPNQTPSSHGTIGPLASLAATDSGCCGQKRNNPIDAASEREGARTAGVVYDDVESISFNVFEATKSLLEILSRVEPDRVEMAEAWNCGGVSQQNGVATRRKF